MQTGARVGRYEVLTPLTTGGMAQLFLGRMEGPGGIERHVVIKRILSTDHDVDLGRMLLEEGRITAALTHPNIVQLLDAGEDDEGFYLVLEHVPGKNLNEVLAACNDRSQVFPLSVAVAVVNDCATALHFAHTFKLKGQLLPVIHRDVAQKNIMLSWDGQTKLLDFGIARQLGGLSRTRTGTIKGTAGYMAPEQVRALPVDARTDVFALGVVLWELCTGQRLFAADTELAELKLILEHQPPRPDSLQPSVSRALADVAMRAIEKDPAARFDSARAFSKALKAAFPDSADDEARAAFMRGLFADEVAQSERQVTPRTVVRKPPPKKPKVTAEEERLAELALQAEQLAEPAPSGPRRPLGPLVVLAVVVLVAAAIGKRALFTEPRRSADGLTLWEGEPDDAEAPGTAPSLAQIPGAPERPPQPLVPIATSPTIEEPPEHRAAPPKARGEATFAFPAGAVVFRGKERLGEGHLVTFSLPVGRHQLTIVGPDQVRRRLSFQMQPGKMKAQRFGPDDLPAE